MDLIAVDLMSEMGLYLHSTNCPVPGGKEHFFERFEEVARAKYIDVDMTTFNYLIGRQYHLLNLNKFEEDSFRLGDKIKYTNSLPDGWPTLRDQLEILQYLLTPIIGATIAKIECEWMIRLLNDLRSRGCNWNYSYTFFLTMLHDYGIRWKAYKGLNNTPLPLIWQWEDRTSAIYYKVIAEGASNFVGSARKAWRKKPTSVQTLSFSGRKQEESSDDSDSDSNSDSDGDSSTSGQRTRRKKRKTNKGRGTRERGTRERGTRERGTRGTRIRARTTSWPSSAQPWKN
jgi:hypothetical protein